MTPFILKLLNLELDDAETISGMSIHVRPAVPWSVIIVAAALLFLSAWWLYRSTPKDVSRGRRGFMTILRIAFFLILLGIIIRPVLSLTMEREARRTLVVLLDSSSSMGIADPREEPDDRVRAGIAKGEIAPDAGLGEAPPLAEPVSRRDIAAGILANEELALFDKIQEKADVAAYKFGEGIEGFSLEAPEIESDSPATALGDALREVLRRRGAEDLAAIFLITDGAHNEGPSPLAAAASLRDRGIPVFAYGTGVTGSRDIAVTGIKMPDVALAEDGVAVSVLVDGRGVREGETGRLVLKLAGATVAEKDFVFTGKGEQEITASFVPKEVGEYEIEATVEGAGGEVLDDNNSYSQNLRVIDSAIRVLIAEQSPRWEYQYLSSMLLRERRIDLQIYLADADPEISRVPDSPYIEEFPARREDLFKYDLVIFGDVDPKTISDSQRDMLAAFVSEGGGSLIMLSGRRFNPAAYKGTPLANLLPVDLKSTTLSTGASKNTRPVQPVLTEAGRNSAMLSLEDDEEANLTRWAGFPPIYWTADVENAKPAAEVLLTRETDATGNPAKIPVIALHRYGSGEVLFIGTDNFWRWRKKTGDEFHTVFWGQVVQRMAGRRLAVGDRKVDLKADKRTANPGERVTVFARLLGDDWQSRTDTTVRAVLEPRDGDGLAREVMLHAVPGTPGYYRAEFTASEEGNYRLRLPGSGGGDGGTTGGGVDITVRSDDKEFTETALNEPLLREIAETSGGAFLREEDLHKLPGMLSVEPRSITTTKEAEVWASPIYFILLLIPITIEWFLRKWSELK
jgi:uncharacterized membrane protein